MTNVPRRDGCFARDGDPCDLSVADLNTAAEPPALGSEFSRGFRGHIIEGKHTAVEIVHEHLYECIFESMATAARLQDLESEPHFKDRHRRRPDGLRRLTVDPGQNAIIRLLPEEL